MPTETKTVKEQKVETQTNKLTFKSSKAYTKPFTTKTLW